MDFRGYDADADVCLFVCLWLTFFFGVLFLVFVFIIIFLGEMIMLKVVMGCDDDRVVMIADPDE